ncbi:hypothetical protein HK101_011418 [Irineochytrium annulatum]|nr:hypothetical protein HK101_011418 [Irineochytrium annulatum]
MVPRGATDDRSISDGKSAEKDTEDRAMKLERVPTERRATMVSTTKSGKSGADAIVSRTTSPTTGTGGAFGPVAGFSGSVYASLWGGPAKRPARCVKVAETAPLTLALDPLPPEPPQPPVVTRPPDPGPAARRRKWGGDEIMDFPPVDQVVDDRDGRPVKWRLLGGWDEEQQGAVPVEMLRYARRRPRRVTRVTPVASDVDKQMRAYIKSRRAAGNALGQLCVIVGYVTHWTMRACRRWTAIKAGEALQRRRDLRRPRTVSDAKSMTSEQPKEVTKAKRAADATKPTTTEPPVRATAKPMLRQHPDAPRILLMALSLALNPTAASPAPPRPLHPRQAIQSIPPPLPPHSVRTSDMSAPAAAVPTLRFYLPVPELDTYWSPLVWMMTLSIERWRAHGVLSGVGVEIVVGVVDPVSNKTGIVKDLMVGVESGGVIGVVADSSMWGQVGLTVAESYGLPVCDLGEDRNYPDFSTYMMIKASVADSLAAMFEYVVSLGQHSASLLVPAQYQLHDLIETLSVIYNVTLTGPLHVPATLQTPNPCLVSIDSLFSMMPPYESGPQPLMLFYGDARTFKWCHDAARAYGNSNVTWVVGGQAGEDMAGGGGARMGLVKAEEVVVVVGRANEGMEAGIFERDWLLKQNAVNSDVTVAQLASGVKGTAMQHIAVPASFSFPAMDTVTGPVHFQDNTAIRQM